MMLLSYKWSLNILPVFLGLPDVVDFHQSRIVSFLVSEVPTKSSASLFITPPCRQQPSLEV